MPNVKTKKFDFSILIASLSIVLVICCAVVCCVFGVSSVNQVAQAEETDSEELLFDGEHVITIDSYTDFPFYNNCIYINSSFDFSLLENPIRSFFVDTYAYDDIFIYQLANIRMQDISYAFQYLFFVYWQGNGFLILSTDEYTTEIGNGTLLNYFDSYNEFYTDYLDNFTVWYTEFFITETSFQVSGVYHYVDYISIDHALEFFVVNGTDNIFMSYIDRIISFTPYFINYSNNGVLYVPISDNGDLTINSYITKSVYTSLCHYMQDFDFSDYTSITGYDEDFYPLFDTYVRGFDCSFGYSLSAGVFVYILDDDIYELGSFYTVGPYLLSSYDMNSPVLIDYRFEIVDIKPLYYDIQHFLNYELEFGYVSDLGLLFSATDGYLTSSYIYATRYSFLDGYHEGYRDGYDVGEGQGFQAGYDDGVNDANDLNQVIIDGLQADIDELQAELDYYRSLVSVYQWQNILNASFDNLQTYTIDIYSSNSKGIVTDSSYPQVAFRNDIDTYTGICCILNLPRVYNNPTFKITGHQIGASGSDGYGFQLVSVGYVYEGHVVGIDQFSSIVDVSLEFTIDAQIDKLVFFCNDSKSMWLSDVQIYQRFDDIESAFDASYNQGFDQGKLVGQKTGEQIGYENGYSDAREKYINNDYSFFSLISAVLDAPLQIIIGTDEKPGMLNFYIPGLDINIAPFLLSLFSVALVIAVIRFILARAS